jgi:hypothetical protein
VKKVFEDLSSPKRESEPKKTTERKKSSDSSSSSDEEKKNKIGVKLRTKIKDVKKVFEDLSSPKRESEPKKATERKKSSDLSSSSDEEKRKQKEPTTPKLLEPEMDVDAIMKQKLKDYRRSLSPEVTGRKESCGQKFEVIPDEKSVFKIVRQHPRPVDERTVDKSSSSSSSSSSSDDDEDRNNISLQDCQTEKDVDTIMKEKLVEYKRKMSQSKSPEDSKLKRPSRLSLSIRHEEEVGGESDPLTPQKRHLGELVSRYDSSDI